MWLLARQWFDRSPAKFVAVVFAIFLVRYIIVAGGFYCVFWRLRPKAFSSRKIQSDSRPTQIGFEIKNSLVTMVFQSLFAGVLYWLFTLDWIKVYFDISERGWGYALASLFGLFVWHDIYFYWSHRFMHLKVLYQRVHLIHHRSINPTPFASLSASPAEGIIEIGFLLPYLLLVPMHPGVLLAFLTLTYVFNITGHLGFEMTPKGTWDSWWGKWLTTNTHHNLHHQNPNGNFGLYLRYWDKWFGTLNPKTGPEFRRLTE